MYSTGNAIQKYSQHEQFINNHVEEIGKIVRSIGENLEGNSFYHGNTEMTSWFFIYKRINFINLVLDNKVKKMAEIGFNAGHSIAVFLATLPQDGSILLFDLNDHNYAMPCYEYLKSKHPQIKEFIPGDSRETMLQYINKHPEELGTYDLIHIDGGHSEEIVVSDIFFSDKLLRSGGIMILDDTQLKCIENQICSLLNRGYTFVYQIPTYGFSHVCMMKDGFTV